MTPPTHTHTADCSARITEFTTSEFGTLPTLRTNTTSAHPKENNRPHGRPLYTPLASRKIQSRTYEKRYS